MSALTRLIEGIEAHASDEIEASIAQIETLIFSLIRDFSEHNEALLETLFAWLRDVHRGGPELIDFDYVLGTTDASAALEEARKMSRHWDQGGLSDAIETPAINNCVERFEAKLGEAAPKPIDLTVPWKKPSFFGSMFKKKASLD